MAAANATVNLTVQWTPPSAAVNSGNASFTVQTPYNAQQVGQIEIGTSDPPNTIYPVAFGSTTKAKVLLIRNMASSEIGVRLNGAVTNNFNIPAGGEFLYSTPSVPSAFPISSASVVSTATPATPESVFTFVFSD